MALFDTGRLFASITTTSSCVTMRPRPNISLRVYPSIAKDVRKRARQTIAALRPLIHLEHEIDVQVVPGVVIKMPGGGLGFGVFRFERCSGITIFIAGMAPPVDFMKRSDWLSQVREVICHEFVHYEQYRDGKRLSERGVRVRARNLVKLIGVA